jgi:competence protein ComEA
VKKLVRNFFGFSTVETNGFLLLIPFMLLVLFSEPLYRTWISSQLSDFSRSQKHLDSLIALSENKTQTENIFENDAERKLFFFNPNNISQNELIELGFSGVLAARIENYRIKGGNFKVKNDLLKIYGMDSILFNELKSFILLPETYAKKEFTASNFTKENKQKTEVVRFDINTADTSQLKSIYGIGEKLSLRIIKYRESLGGFVRQEQFNEVFGLDSAVINRLTERSFVEQNFTPLKLNINNATEQELDRHPYLNRTQAKAILTYRFQHGKFTSVDELQKIQLLDKTTIDKISPYLSID